MHYELHDRTKLEDARRLLLEVWEDNYTKPQLRQKEDRLGTIIRKLNALLAPESKQD